MINVLLVDDHELVRTGTQRILDEVRGIKVIGTAETEEAVSYYVTIQYYSNGHEYAGYWWYGSCVEFSE